MGRAIPGNGVIVLVVDDALTRLNAVAIVEEAGFEAIAASNADEAIQVLESRADIQAVFTDVQMPAPLRDPHP
jgi:CheY-like chemotaxis protein